MMSDRDRAERIREIFAAIVGLSAAERAARLAEACGDDGALRSEVESLLAAADEPGSGVQRILDALRPSDESDSRRAVGAVLRAFQAALRDGYALKREIGRGGMATVYLAKDLKHRRDVAVKVLDPELSQALGTERFLREIEVAANLRHPHILPLFDSGEAAGLLYYVMPYIEGESLRERLDRERQLPVAEAVRIASEIADALAYAHDKGVTHRDVKPGNILVDAGHAVLADFGVAMAMGRSGQSRLTRTGTSLGTPAYMSPEQVAGERTLDGRSDQYALACVLYEMLAGDPPFRGAWAEDVARQHLTADPPPVTDFRPAVPVAVARALARSLAKNPADRFPTTGEFGAALTEGLLTVDEGVPAHDQAGDRARTARRPTRIASWGAAGATAVAAIAVTTFMITRSGDDAVDPDRVAVLPFVNRTGADSLDSFGAILADFVSGQLERTGLVDVLPSADVHRVLAVAGPDRESIDLDLVRGLTGAGLIIDGSYFSMNDSLRIQPQIVESTGRRGLPIDMVVAPAHDGPGALRLVLARVQIALSTRVDPRLAEVAPFTQLPMKWDAYVEYMAGLEARYAGDNTAATPHFYRAAELDPTTMSPLIWAAFTEWNASSNLPVVDSLLRIVEARRNDLLRFDRAFLDWLRGFLDGDWDLVGDATFRLATVAGRGIGRGGIVQHRYITNRIDDAQKWMRQWERGLPDYAQQAGYWQFLSVIEHAKGDHRDELKAVRNGIAKARSRGNLSNYEIRALAALGEMEELRARLRDAMPRDSSGLNGVFYRAASELRAHRRPKEAAEIGRLAVAHYEMAIADAPSWMARYHLAVTLFDLDPAEHERARPMFEELARQMPPPPFTWSNYDVAALGYLGKIAAVAGDTVGARSFIDELGRLDRKYLRGAREHWQARIAAQLGQCQRAVRYLDASVNGGSSFHIDSRDGGYSLAEIPELMALQEAGCVEYDRFIEPK